MEDNYKLRFPVGEFTSPPEYSSASIEEWIRVIEEFPSRLRKIAGELGADRLLRQYRESGWTGNQVIHHCADSHMNAFIRMKLALTEDVPSVKPYDEARWAELPDAKGSDIELSLSIIDSLHARWVKLLKSLGEKDFGLTYFHPEHGREFTIAEALAMYAWHCNHHYAHIAMLDH